MLLPALFGGVDFVVASLCTPLITAFSIAGGIGGGGLLVPLYSVVLGLGPCRRQPPGGFGRFALQRHATLEQCSGRSPALASVGQPLPIGRHVLAGRHTGLTRLTGLGPKAAVPVSLAAIAGTALSNLVSSATDRHPLRARPLIDYTTAVSMQVHAACACTRRLTRDR